MKILKLLTLALGLLTLASCDQAGKIEKEDQTGKIENKDQAENIEKGDQTGKIEQSKDSDGEGWSLNQNENKMKPGEFNNVLTKKVTTNATTYLLTFGCDYAWVKTYENEALNGNLPGKPIPFSYEVNGYNKSFIRPFNIRYGDNTIRAELTQADYNNVGYISAYRDSTGRYVGAKDPGHPHVINFLSSDIFNISSIIPGETIELNPDGARSLINKFIEKCPKSELPPSAIADEVPGAETTVDATLATSSPNSEDTNAEQQKQQADLARIQAQTDATKSKKDALLAEKELLAEQRQQTQTQQTQCNYSMSQPLSCASRSNQPATCAWDFEACGNPVLGKQESKTSCNGKVNVDRNAGQIIVTNGCRALFVPQR